MGLLSRIRKKSPKKRPKRVGTRKKTSKRVGTVSTRKQALPTSDLLKNWSKTIEMVEKHPLSQARVMNTAVLSDLTRVLNSMDEKLSKLDKLDKIVSLLGETKKQLSSAGLSTSMIDQAIDRIKGLTIKDKNAFEVFKSKDELTTEGFAEVSKVSRSTASSRLNRLFSFGLLEKNTDGKKIVYRAKQ
jgi:DNA-binding transcriptional ArsR family regulator